MYRYDCHTVATELEMSSLLCLYNQQFYKKLSQSELTKLINQHIEQSNADYVLPISIYKNDKIISFCIVHLYKKEKIKNIGNLTFSLLISDLKEDSISLLFSSIFKEIRSQGFNLDHIVGPIHNSILIPRGYRIFDDNIYTYGMPDNNLKTILALENYGAVKRKDIVEILYKYNKYDLILTSLDSKFLRRITDCKFELIDKDKIKKNSLELAEAYNQIWKDNWGFSGITSELILVAAESIPNILGMIAKKDNNIIGFTMMQYCEGMGRAFMAGVLNLYKNKGLSIALISHLSKTSISRGVSMYSIGWMLEDNKQIINTMKKFTRNGNSKLRSYRIYEIKYNV
ncbi:hypothetical protein EV693_102108 [Nicoletella semolina]|uniref:N-acetyltransferase domain-containing protein n=1 Tax=Nicoletella semolina TaxID=271160 RepID=A0A4R2NBA3_9PAST|nr:hypothetical protein [Nicoletella semolina]MDH2924888.1 hypothetical protein [Nicoletella semolina]TCP18429.1 hypothetical protein EV693_102108 [Nicoletella semolina]